MVVNCTQTTHQKETIRLIKDFFESADNIDDFSKVRETIISKLYGVTGIKFDKPFMAEVFEGSFTTSSLLEKYPINKSQVMYIFTIRESHSWYYDKTFIKVRATRVYHSGKVFIKGNGGNEKYFDFEHAPIYYYLSDYTTDELKAIKTLVLVANKKDIVEKEHRKFVLGKENYLIQHIANGYNNAYKTRRVEWVEREDNIDWVTLREGSGKKYEYRNSDYFKQSDYCEHFDKSGYCVEAFREFLSRRLGDYRNYLRLKRVVRTDYTLKLLTRYEEVIVLKNLIATSIINNTDLKTLKTLNCLTDKITDVIELHEVIMGKLKRSKEVYEECEHKSLNIGWGAYSYYAKVTDVKEDLEDLDSSIAKIKTELFDKILQQDI